MKRQRVTSEPHQIQASKYRKHQQLKEVFKRYPANRSERYENIKASSLSLKLQMIPVSSKAGSDMTF